ncbi:FMN-binding protein [Myxococcota bacterium]|nr:FMN-binding protein [Myxococcota bacterium]MBU1380382.1 FMN-binding protein [Myxococcota bacterium]MBU1496525.1 FMN-binding protein [Myxococcota bacterium]
MRKIIIFSLSMFMIVSCSKKKDDAPVPPAKETKVNKQPDKEVVMLAPKKIEPEKKPDAKPVEKTPKKEVFIKADIIPASTVATDKPVKHYQFKIKEKTVLALSSKDFPELKDIKGYTSRFDVQVAFDEKGNIVAAGFGDNKETPEFMDRVKKEWLAKVQNIKKGTPIIGKGGIDALSEATVTTEAILKYINALRTIHTKHFPPKK